jgi:hypothetical protein
MVIGEVRLGRRFEEVLDLFKEALLPAYRIISNP